MSEAQSDKPGGGATPPPQPSLLQSLQAVWRELPGLINDRVDLLALEVQRAGKALMQILALVVVAAILAVTAWLALWGVVVGLLMTLGLHWSLALLGALLVNVGAAWWAVARVRSLTPALRLPATRRHLTFSPSPQPDGAAQRPSETRAPPTSTAGPAYASNAASHAGTP